MTSISNGDALPNLKSFLVSGTLWALAGRFLSVLFNVFVSAVLARLLDPEGFGSYLLLVSLASFGSLIILMGLAQAIVKLVSESMAQNLPVRAFKAVYVSFLLVLVSSLVVVSVLSSRVGAWLGQYFLDAPDANSLMGWLGLWIAAIAMNTLAIESFRGFGDLRMANLMGDWLNRFLALVVLGIFYLWQRPVTLPDAVVVVVSAVLVNFALAFFLLLSVRMGPPLRYRGLGLFEPLKVSWPMWISALTFFFLNNVDLWIVAAYRSERDVALYGVALRVVNLFILPLAIANSVLSPVIARLHSRGEHRVLEKALRSMASAAGFPAVVALIVLVGFSGSFLALFFGEIYRQSGVVLSILCIGQAVQIAVGACGLTLLMTGHQRSAMVATFGFGLLKLGGILLVVGQSSLETLALIGALSIALYNLTLFVLARSLSGVWTHVDIRHLGWIRGRLRQYGL